MPLHALTVEPDAPEAMARSLRRQAGGLTPSLVLYFASCDLDAERIAGDVADCFPGARTVGCSADREYTNAGFTRGGVAALAFGRDVVPDVAIALVAGLPDGIPGKVEEACARLTADIGDPRALFDPDRYVGLVLMDALSRSEERVMERLGDLSSIPFVGGSASDSWTFDRTWVAIDGRPQAAADALILLRPACRWAVGKTQSWQMRDGPALVPTRVDLDKRRVHEFDGVPAADRYAAMLGFARATLDTEYCFKHHPFGLYSGDELFVRHPNRVHDDGAMDFFCRLHQGQPVNILTATPLLRDTEDRLAAFARTLGGPLRAVVDFCCEQRYAALNEMRGLRDYTALLPAVPRVGFATYGEQYIGHINCTSTMIAFGEPAD